MQLIKLKGGEKIMAKKKSNITLLGKTLNFLIWLTGVIVALAVAFGLIDGTLVIRWISLGVLEFLGGVIVVTTLLGVILAITKQFE